MELEMELKNVMIKTLLMEMVVLNLVQSSQVIHVILQIQQHQVQIFVIVIQFQNQQNGLILGVPSRYPFSLIFSIIHPSMSRIVILRTSAIRFSLQLLLLSLVLTMNAFYLVLFLYHSSLLPQEVTHCQVTMQIIMLH